MTKINQILSDWIPGDVHTLKWFAKKGVGQRTAHQYYESSSLEKIGSGVFSRKGDKLHWAGAVRSMQEELGLKMHVGGFSALSLQGVGHQVSFERRIELVTNSKFNLPSR